MSGNQLANELATKLETANKQVLAVARTCSPEQWGTMVPEEGRTVGTLFHHLAYPTPIVMSLVMSVANGGPLPTDLTDETTTAFNAQHAAENALPDMAETLSLLETTCQEAVAQLRTLTDEQLQIATEFSQPYLVAQASRIDGKYGNARQLVEWNLIYHRQDHLSRIEAVL